MWEFIAVMFALSFMMAIILAIIYLEICIVKGMIRLVILWIKNNIRK